MKLISCKIFVLGSMGVTCFRLRCRTVNTKTLFKTGRFVFRLFSDFFIFQFFFSIWLYPSHLLITSLQYSACIVSQVMRSCASPLCKIKLICCFYALEPFLVDTNMTIVCADWNHNGSCLAIAGKQPLSAVADGGDQGGKKSSSNTNAIQFFSHTGEARLFLSF